MPPLHQTSSQWQTSIFNPNPQLVVNPSRSNSWVSTVGTPSAMATNTIAAGIAHEMVSMFSSTTPQSPNAAASVTAWNQFLSDLQPYERDLFLKNKINNLSEYLGNLHAASNDQAQKSYLISISSKLRPLIDAINIYLPVTQTVTQASPMPATYVLGGITCILSVPTRFLDYQEQVIDHLAEMGNCFKVLTRYDQELLRYDDQVRECLINVFGDILRFCRQAAKVFYDEQGRHRNATKLFVNSLWQDYRKSFGTIFNDFKKNYDLFKEHRDIVVERNAQRYHSLTAQAWMQQTQDNQMILGHISFVNNEMFADRMRKEAEMIAAKALAEKQDEEVRKRNMNMWADKLPAIDFGGINNIQNGKFSDRVEGTGTWLLENDDFEEWRANQQGSRILGVYGGAGSGKSCLAALTIHELMQECDIEEKSAVAYLYCSSIDKTSNMEPRGLLASVLQQICRQLPNSALTPLEKIFQRDFRYASLDQLRENIIQVACQLKKVYVVVDGLDECHQLGKGDFEAFCNCIYLLATENPSAIKVIFFTRSGYPEIDGVFSSVPKVIVDTNSNLKDIKLFISDIVSSKKLHVRGDEDLLKRICETLLANAEGMFLWVTLLMKSLQELRTRKEIEVSLIDLPGDLNNAYERAMLRILSYRNQYVKERALKILLWVTNTKRPLVRAELYEALAIENGSKTLDRSDIIPLDGDEGLTSECADLIILKDDRYYLLHASLLEFFQQIAQQDDHPLQQFSNMQRNANEIIALSCLTYLQFDMFDHGPLMDRNSLADFDTNNPFHFYAANHWGHHVTPQFELRHRKTISNFLASPEKLNLSFQAMSEGVEPHLYQRIFQAELCTPLHILSLFNMRDTASIFGDRPVQHDCFGWFPHQCALRSGAKEILLWLLDHEEHQKALLNRAGTGVFPVHEAARHDWADVLERLFRLGYDANSAKPVSQRTPLHEAADLGCDSAVETLLKVMEVDPVDASGDTPLLKAAGSNHLSTVRLLLRHGANVNQRGWRGYSALHHACGNGNLVMVNELLRMKPDINVASNKVDYERMPIHVAADFNQPEIIQVLVKQGADVEAKAVNGFTPMLCAALNGSMQALEILVKLGGRTDAITDRGLNALHVAVREEEIKIIERLCAVDPGLLHVDDSRGYTPLHIAIRRHKTEIARLLLKLGASSTQINSTGADALSLAVQVGNVELATDLLAQVEVDCDREDSNGYTPLQFAACLGLVDLLEPLIRVRGADPEAMTQRQQRPLHFASFFSHFRFIEEMVKMVPDLDLNPSDKSGHTPLLLAARNGATDIVSFLLDRGVKETPHVNNDLPIHQAAWNGHWGVVDLLMTRENVNTRGNGGLTPLHAAVYQGHIRIVCNLLDFQADVNIANDNGSTPLLTALSDNHEKISWLLLKRGANAQICNKRSRSPLYAATRNGYIKLVQYLLDQKCNPLLQDHWGETPFLAASRLSSTIAVEVFLQHGFDGRDIVNYQGRSPLTEAVCSGNINMVELLLQDREDVQADLAIADYSGCNLICHAAASGNLKMMNWLSDHGVGINGTDQQTVSPLHTAAMGGHGNVVIELVRLGATIDQLSKPDRRTPLICALLRGLPETTRILLDVGADPHIRDIYGSNALDYACCIPDPWLIFNTNESHYETPEPQNTRRKARKAVRNYVQCILDLSNNPFTQQVGNRKRLLTRIIDGLALINSTSADELAQQIQQELIFAYTPHTFNLSLQCSICRVRVETEELYICKTCMYRRCLCFDCHMKYSQGERSAPQSLVELYHLEEKVRKIRLEFNSVERQNINFIGRTFTAVCQVWESVLQILVDYDHWESQYDAEGLHRKPPMPGREFLRSLKRADKLLAQLEQDGAAQQIQGAEDMHSIITENHRSDSDSSASETNEEYTVVDTPDRFEDELKHHFKIYRPDTEVAEFRCTEHEYLEVPYLDFSRPDHGHTAFDENGMLTREWFSNLLRDLNDAESAESADEEEDPDEMLRPEPRDLQSSAEDGQERSTTTRSGWASTSLKSGNMPEISKPNSHKADKNLTVPQMDDVVPEVVTQGVIRDEVGTPSASEETQYQTLASPERDRTLPGEKSYFVLNKTSTSRFNGEGNERDSSTSSTTLPSPVSPGIFAKKFLPLRIRRSFQRLLVKDLYRIYKLENPAMVKDRRMLHKEDKSTSDYTEYGPQSDLACHEAEPVTPKSSDPENGSGDGSGNTFGDLMAKISTDLVDTTPPIKLIKMPRSSSEAGSCSPETESLISEKIKLLVEDANVYSVAINLVQLLEWGEKRVPLIADGDLEKLYEDLVDTLSDDGEDEDHKGGVQSEEDENEETEMEIQRKCLDDSWIRSE